MRLHSTVCLVLGTLKMWKNGIEKKLWKLERRRVQGMGEGARRARNKIFPSGKSCVS